MLLMTEASLTRRTHDSKESTKALTEKERAIVTGFEATGVPEYVSLTSDFIEQWRLIFSEISAKKERYKLKQKDEPLEEQDMAELDESETRLAELDKDFYTKQLDKDLEKDAVPLLEWMIKLQERFEGIPIPSQLFETMAQEEYDIAPKKGEKILEIDGKKRSTRDKTIFDASLAYSRMADRNEPWTETSDEKDIKLRDKILDLMDYFSKKIKKKPDFVKKFHDLLGDLRMCVEDLKKIRVIGGVYEQINNPLQFSSSVSQAEYKKIVSELEVMARKLVISQEGLSPNQEVEFAEIEKKYKNLRGFKKEISAEQDKKIVELNHEIVELAKIVERYKAVMMKAIKKYGKRWGDDRVRNVLKKTVNLGKTIEDLSQVVKDKYEQGTILDFTAENLKERTSDSIEELKTELRVPFDGEQENYFNAEYNEFRDLFGEHFLGFEELKDAFRGLETHDFRVHAKAFVKIFLNDGTYYAGTERRSFNYDVIDCGEKKPGRIIPDYKHTSEEDLLSINNTIITKLLKDGKVSLDGVSLLDCPDSRNHVSALREAVREDWIEKTESRINCEVDISKKDEAEITERLFDFKMEPQIYDFLEQVEAGKKDVSDWTLFVKTPQRYFKWDISDKVKKELAEVKRKNKNHVEMENKPVEFQSRLHAFYYNGFIDTTPSAKTGFQWRLMRTEPDAIIRPCERKKDCLIITNVTCSSSKLASITDVQQFQAMWMRKHRVNPLEGQHRLVAGAENPRKSWVIYNYTDNSQLSTEHRINMAGHCSPPVTQTDLLDEYNRKLEKILSYDEYSREESQEDPRWKSFVNNQWREGYAVL